MRLKAVAFDVDGTLYPNASMYLRSLGMALGNLRLLKTLEWARGELRDQPDTSDDFHRVQARLVATKLGLTPERAYALIEGRVYTKWFKIFTQLRPYAGLSAAIADFRAAGLKTAVLSDFPIRKRVEDLGLTGPWDCSFSSEETGYLKPNPQPFHVLASRLELHESEVLYVGNSYTYDVLGALSAGMPAAHLTRHPRPNSQAALSFHSYDQLRDFVFRCQEEKEYDEGTGRVSS